MKMGLAALCLLAAGASRAANLDVTAAYKEKAVDYTNLNLNKSEPNDHSFLYSDGRLGIAVSKIYLATQGAEDTTMDVGLLMHALGASGASGTLSSTPFNRVAANYPSTDFTPFFENAYIRVHNLFGKPVEATFGRQSFKLGTGMILDDDGAGFDGVTVRGNLPFWGMSAQGFVFEDHNPLIATFPNNANAPYQTPFFSGALTMFGASVLLPTEGTWELNELVESDHSVAPVYGCTYTDPSSGDTDQCMASRALRSFTDVDYKVSYGPLVFDGEAAIEKGVATPTNGQDLTNPNPTVAPAASPTHITYDGNAVVFRAKWKQPIYHWSTPGIARVSLARGSGTGGGTTDGAFFPSHGHQFDGLERDGFGDFFGASPYSAFGGNYSTSTLSGLQQGDSGIIVVGVGYTPPSYKGFALDLDYFLFQADRVTSGPRTLAGEYDTRIRYNVLDHFALAAGADFVQIGSASYMGKGSARKYYFQAQGRF